MNAQRSAQIPAKYSTWPCRSRFGTLCVVVIIAVATLVGCGKLYPNTEPASGPPHGVEKNIHDVVIGFVQQQLQAPYYAAMQKMARDIADQDGIRLIFQSANSDPSIQMNQMQSMIAQGADVLVVNAISVQGQKQMMTQIASQVPVVYIDTSVPGTGVTAVQSDNKLIGRLSGRLTAQRLTAEGKKSITMAVVGGPATDANVGPDRRQGFLDGLTDGGIAYTVVAQQSGAYAQDTGQSAAENMLAAHPDVDLILGLNDSMTLGAYRAIKANPRYSAILVAASADGQKDALKLIADEGCQSRYVSTGLNSPALATIDAMRIAVDIATGKTTPKDYPAESFTKAVGIGCDNAAEYYKPDSVF